MKKIIGVALLAVLCSGCVAHMMETRGGKVMLIKPQGQKPGKGGVIRYLNTGFQSWRQARRADAEKQMNHFCSGSYTISAEGPRSQFGASMPVGTSVSVEVDQYWYIAFDCISETKS